MIIYVAGPMTGLPELNYPAFNAAAQMLAPRYDVLNPASIVADGEQTWKWYMCRALEMVVRADGIALLEGWQKSRGAQLEYHVGYELGLIVLPLKEWL